MGLLLGTRRSLFGSEAYYEKVKGYGPIAYWPMWEGSGTAATCLINSAQNGTYTGVTLGQTGIGDGHSCPLFDGSNDVCNVYTTTFRDAFSGVAGTVMAWAKVSGSGVWAELTARRVFSFAVDSNNYVRIFRPTATNRLDFKYEAGNVTETVALAGLTTVDWMHVVVTWDKNAGANGEVKAYYAGAQTGSTQTSLGTWAGSLETTKVCIGANTTTPATVWDGYLAHVAVWDSALAAATIAGLATV